MYVLHIDEETPPADDTKNRVTPTRAHTRTQIHQEYTKAVPTEPREYYLQTTIDQPATRSNSPSVARDHLSLEIDDSVNTTWTPC